jgi:hypothetical protein
LVLNAYVQPTVQQYFARLQSAFADVGIRCPFSAMQSNGGTASFEWAKEHPITLIESGPAAGVNGGGEDTARRFSPFCWRIRVALAHKGLTVETIPWRFTEKAAIVIPDRNGFRSSKKVAEY